MPITMGPITLASCPGTGSRWLQEVCRGPLGFGWKSIPGICGGPLLERTAQAGANDRHVAGPATVTITRNVAELLRTWFVRFRNPPLDPTQLPVLRSERHTVVMGEFNETLGYWGPDFKTWLDAYLSNAGGWMTTLLDRYAQQAANVLHTEHLTNESIAFFHRQEIKFEEEDVRTFPRLGVRNNKPPWPIGYRDKILYVG